MPVFQEFAFSLITEFAILHSYVIGNFRTAKLAGKILNCGLVMLMHASIASCMMLVVFDQVLYPCHGSSLSSWVMKFGLALGGS